MTLEDQLQDTRMNMREKDKQIANKKKLWDYDRNLLINTEKKIRE
jgi:hypothetical protein